MPGWLWFLIGAIVGELCGIFTVALMQAAKSDDDA